MKLTTLQDTAATALGIVGKAVASRSTLPILANVLIEADGELAAATACNLEVYLRVEFGAKVAEPGRLTLPHKTLADLVNTMPAEPLTLATDDKRATATLTCGRTKSTIKGTTADEFPVMPRLDRLKATAIGAQTLKCMVRAVAFASLTDTSRPVLASQYWRLGDGSLKLATSDGYRVAEVSRLMDGPTCAAILPARAAEILAQLIDGNDEDVLFELRDGRALFRVGSVELVAVLIDGEFPRYEGIVPKAIGTKVTLATSDAVRACKTVDVIARDAASAHFVRMTVKPGSELAPGSITFCGEAAETGDGVVEIDAKVEGPEMVFALNAVYAREAFAAVTTPSLSIEAVSPTSPVMVRPVGEDGQWSITMPLHLGK